MAASGMEDPCDILEEDDGDGDEPGMAPYEAGLLPSASTGGLTQAHSNEEVSDFPGGLAAQGGLPEGMDPGDIKAALGGMTQELAQSLQSITEEMNRMKAELYGDQGIGGIAKEIEKLKTSGLGQLLGEKDMDSMLGGLGGGSDSLSSLGSGLREASAGSAMSASRPSAARSGAVQRPAQAPRGQGGNASLDRDRKADFERIQQKIRESRLAEKKKAEAPTVSLGEKGLLFIVVLVCLYVGSPFFRTSVNRAVSMVLFGEAGSDFDEDF